MQVPDSNSKLYSMFLMLVFVLLSMIIIWVYSIVRANDFSVPSVDPSKFKNVLVVFPHADDEVLTVGGLVSVLKDEGAKTTLVVLTKGEKGTPDASLDSSLKGIRVKEAKKAAKVLGFTQLIQKDFGDGELNTKKQELKNYLSELLASSDFDLVITYDLSGLYGHEDHIAVSELITELIKQATKTNYTHPELWYASSPKKVLQKLSLPEHMAKTPEFKEQQKEPNAKVFVGPYVLNKINAIYSYESQFKSYTSGLPIKWIPPWFYYSLTVCEYFYKVDLSSKS